MVGSAGESAVGVPGNLLTLEGILENIALFTGTSFVGSVAWRSGEGVWGTTATSLSIYFILLFQFVKLGIEPRDLCILGRQPGPLTWTEEES